MLLPIEARSKILCCLFIFIVDFINVKARQSSLGAYAISIIFLQAWSNNKYLDSNALYSDGLSHAEKYNKGGNVPFILSGNWSKFLSYNAFLSLKVALP